MYQRGKREQEEENAIFTSKQVMPKVAFTCDRHFNEVALVHYIDLHILKDPQTITSSIRIIKIYFCALNITFVEIIRYC